MRYRRIYYNRRPNGGLDWLSFGCLGVAFLWVARPFLYLLLLWGFPATALWEAGIPLFLRIILGIAAPLYGLNTLARRHVAKAAMRHRPPIGFVAALVGPEMVARIQDEVEQQRRRR